MIIVFPFLNSYFAPESTLPSSLSFLVIVTLVGVFFKTVVPSTLPFSLTTNLHSSLDKMYPSGAIVSLNVYSPTASFPIIICPFLSVTPLNTWLLAESKTSIVAPATPFPVTASVFVRITSLEVFSRTNVPEIVPSSLIVKEFSFVERTYPLGAFFSTNVYSPTGRFLTIALPSLSVVTSATSFPLLSLITNTAPSSATLLVASILVRVISVGAFFKTVVPSIVPSSLTSNSQVSLDKIYPSGAIVSLNVYFPTGSLEISI